MSVSQYIFYRTARKQEGLGSSRNYSNSYLYKDTEWLTSMLGLCGWPGIIPQTDRYRLGRRWAVMKSIDDGLWWRWWWRRNTDQYNNSNFFPYLSLIDAPQPAQVFSVVVVVDSDKTRSFNILISPLWFSPLWMDEKLVDFLYGSSSYPFFPFLSQLGQGEGGQSMRLWINRSSICIVNWS